MDRTQPTSSQRPRRRVLTALLAGMLLATGLHSASGAGSGGVGPFPDVPYEHPFSQEIFWVSHLGIAEGYGDGTYRPSDPVTRGSMAAFLERNFDATDDKTYVAFQQDETATVMSDTSWTMLPGSMIEFSMPAGAGARLISTFSAESLSSFTTFPSL